MNKSLTALLLTTISALAFSHQAVANRPAAEDDMTESNLEQDDSKTQSQAPSAVELMMRQQTQQTGDIVSLPPEEIQAGDTVSIKLLDFPRRGMSMDKVKNEFGQPAAISDSVGTPPITRWTYADRIVFFEYSTVIHVVAR